MRLEYSKKAKAHLENLPNSLIDRILKKMNWFVSQEDPLYFAEPLHGSAEKLYRFRIGNYRTICTVKNGELHILLVLTVKHRKEAYR